MDEPCLELDDEIDNEPPRRVLRSAEGRLLPECSGWPSIFDLAAACAFGRCAALVSAMGPSPPPPADHDRIQDQVHQVIERAPGIVRCSRIHYLDTEAWKEKEIKR